jgi:hypothetical protein
MPRSPYLVQDPDGKPLGVLLSIREQWRQHDLFVFRGRKMSVVAVVPLEPGDSSGCVALLTARAATAYAQ